MNYSYIVRIYRHEKNNPRIFVGTVERVGEQGKAAFTNIDELWELINGATGNESKKENEKGGGGKCQNLSWKQEKQ